MKCLVIIGLLAVINVATCYYYPRDTSDDTSLSSSGSQYMRYIRERQQIQRLRTQFESLCPDKSEEFDEAIIKLKECSNGIDENTETACSALKNHFLRCSQPLVDVLGECLPEESKDVPQLVFQATSSAANYLCKTDGEHIFELVNSCIYKTNSRSMRCERRVMAKLQQYKRKPPTKNELCELAQSMKPCLQTHLQDSCGNRITRESFLGIFDALTAPCKVVTDNHVEYNTINDVEVLS